MNLPLPPVPSSCVNKSAISVPHCGGESDRNEIIKDNNCAHYDNFRYPRVHVVMHNEKFFPLIDSCIDYLSLKPQRWKPTLIPVMKSQI